METAFTLGVISGAIDILKLIVSKNQHTDFINRGINTNCNFLLKEIEANIATEKVINILKVNSIINLTPLGMAIAYKRTEVIKLLVENGADTSGLIGNQISLVEFAKAFNHGSEIIDLLTLKNRQTTPYIKNALFPESTSSMIDIVSTAPRESRIEEQHTRDSRMEIK